MNEDLNGSSEFYLGVRYENGDGVPQDYKAAFYYYNLAASKGCPEAQYNLALLCKNGLGTDRDFEKAVFWYTKAAQQGYAAAQFNLARCYDEGNGVIRDSGKAFYWYSQAAAQDDADAQNYLGYCYVWGEGTEQDYGKARFYFEKAAEQGNADAQYNLGVLYDNGRGAEQNYEKAAYWYLKSAGQGDKRAQYNLGVIYLNGRGKEQDMYKAAEWFKLSAAQGYAEAQYNLALCYCNGYGVDCDFREAERLLTLSANQGNAMAQETLLKLPSLNPAYENSADAQSAVNADVKRRNGFGFRLAQAIIFLLCAVAYVIMPVAMFPEAIPAFGGFYNYYKSFDSFSKERQIKAGWDGDVYAEYWLISVDGELVVKENYIEYAGYVDDSGFHGSEIARGEKLFVYSGYEITETDSSHYEADLIFKADDGTLFSYNANNAYDYYRSFWEMFTILSGAGAGFFVVSVFSFVFAFVGKKKKWANVCSIVVSGIFCLSLVGIALFIWGVVGGALGVKSLSVKREKKLKTQNPAPKETCAVADCAAAPEETCAVENVPPATNAAVSNIKTPDKRVNLGITIGMGVYYLIWLTLGILSMALPQKGIAWGPYEDTAYTIAMNTVTGFMMILLMPSFGYFFVFRGPVRLSRKTGVAIVAACIGVTVVGDVLFYILMSGHLSLVSLTVKIAPVLSEAGLIGLYLVGFLKISPEKLQKSKYKKTGETFKDILGGLLYGILNVMKYLLRGRNRLSFIIIGSVLFTLCTFCVMEVLYVLIGVIAVLIFIVICESLYMPSSVYTQQYLATDSSGSTRTLTYDGYNGFLGEDIYKDDIGNLWATTNNGKSFYPIAADNNRHYKDSAAGKFKDY